MSGITLAIMNIAEYYEMVLLYGIFFLFFECQMSYEKMEPKKQAPD